MTKSNQNVPITRDELQAAIEGSGYPLELWLYYKFEVEGLHAELGTRLHLRDPGTHQEPSTHEVDLLVSVTALLPDDEVLFSLSQEPRPLATVTATIDAKKLHEPSCFVGLLGQRPSERELLAARAHVSGCPSYNVLDDDHAGSVNAIGPDGFCATLGPLCGGPYCVHWGIAKRDGSGDIRFGGDGSKESNTPSAFKEDRYWQSMVNLVACNVHAERTLSQRMLLKKDGRSIAPYLKIYCPTLVIETPTLYTYDVNERALVAVDWFMLRVGVEIDGQIHYRIVDVVSKDGVTSMIKRYQKVRQQMETGLETFGTSLREIGDFRRAHVVEGRLPIFLRMIESD